MYSAYWHLTEEPFSNSLDSRFLYMTPQHSEGIARLVYAAQQHKDGAILTGGYGTGKSFVRSVFISKLGRIANFCIALIENPLAGAESVMTDIYEQICGKPGTFTCFGGLFRELSTVLMERRSKGFYNLVVIEEAQLLSDLDSLEQLRLLMNLKDAGGQSLLSMIFIGQHSVIKSFSRSPGLLQRLSTRWYLSPLTEEQTGDYVAHRLRVAGGNRWIIGADAVNALYLHSQGIIRVINNMADMALYLGMTENAVSVDADIINRVAADLKRGLTQEQEGEA